MPCRLGTARRPSFEEEERAGAVRALRVAGLEAALPDERRLLVAGDAEDRHGPSGNAPPPTVSPKEPLEGRTSGSTRRGDAEERAGGRGRQRARAEVVEERARRVRRVGRVDARRRSGARRASASTVPKRERRRARRGARAPGTCVEEPAIFVAREVRVEDEARAAADAARAPRARSAAHASAVRRHCQTIAGASGARVCAVPERRRSRAGS